MAKKYGIMTALVAVVLAGLTYWMLKDDRDELLSCLPKEVSMVGRVDLGALMAENDHDRSEVQDLVGKWLPFSEKDDSGIDFLSPLYVFASQGYLGAMVIQYLQYMMVVFNSLLQIILL